jgi:hypothetical protein
MMVGMEGVVGGGDWCLWDVNDDVVVSVARCWWIRPNIYFYDRAVADKDDDAKHFVLCFRCGCWLMALPNIYFYVRLNGREMSRFAV